MRGSADDLEFSAALVLLAISSVPVSQVKDRMSSATGPMMTAMGESMKRASVMVSAASLAWVHAPARESSAVKALF